MVNLQELLQTQMHRVDYGVFSLCTWSTVTFQ
jgi:hypothetical protein